MGALIDLTGQRFGRLEVVHLVGIRKQGARSNSEWLCQCDCGEKIVVLALNLKNGNTKSCGCLRREASAQRMKALSNRRWGKI